MEEIIEIENFISKEEMMYIDSEILSHNIPWHYNRYSTSEKYPFFEHVIIPREENEWDIVKITSPLHNFFTNIQKRFCEICDIKLNKIYRQCLNLTFPCDETNHGDPHIDHTFPHKNIIFYLNDGYEMGETLFFDKNSNIIGEVIPQKGKVLCFDGSIYHSVRWIPRGRRIIFVSTFN